MTVQSTPPHAPGRPSDCRLLAALAALHCRYGRFERAQSFVNLSLWIDPAHRATLKIAAVLSLRDLQPGLALSYTDRLAAIGSLEPELAALRRRAVAMRRLMQRRALADTGPLSI
ncbi:MAG: hypothetical protein AAF919_12405 [Pseudomonadota bacterium]